MRELLISSEATKDLEEIINYFYDVNVDAGEIFFTRI
jgi:hypothetical protein